MRLYVVIQKKAKDFRAGMIKTKDNVKSYQFINNPNQLEYVEYKKIEAVSDIKYPQDFLPLDKSIAQTRKLGLMVYTQIEWAIKTLTEASEVWVNKKSQW